MGRVLLIVVCNSVVSCRRWRQAVDGGNIDSLVELPEPLRILLFQAQERRACILRNSVYQCTH